MNIELVKKRVGSRLSIPSLPAVLKRLEEVLRDPQSGMREIAALVGEDPPLAAKTLRMANSSFYGVREAVVTIEHAVSVLGVDALTNMVREGSMFTAWGHLEGNEHVDLSVLWHHAVLTAHMSSRLTEKAVSVPETKEEMYVAGLLHDIGRLVLLDTFPKETVLALETAKETGAPEHEVEGTVIGLSHTQAGSLIAKRWTLPEPVALGIRHHHKSTGDERTRPVVALVTVADKLAHAVADGSLADIRAQSPMDLRRSLGLGIEGIIEVGEEFLEEPDELEV